MYVERTVLLNAVINTFAVALASRVPVIISEAIILGVTWKKTFYSRRNLLQIQATTSLTQCLLRDGM